MDAITVRIGGQPGNKPDLGEGRVSFAAHQSQICLKKDFAEWWATYKYFRKEMYSRGSTEVNWSLRAQGKES